MTKIWEIGKEARELDKKPISERLKVESTSIKKIIFALLFYVLTMMLFLIVF
ncbi:MAG: hypothetical protein ACFFG0_10770 [Candidatus Thorarchaeota archaeon]